MARITVEDCIEKGEIEQHFGERVPGPTSEFGVASRPDRIDALLQALDLGCHSGMIPRATSGALKPCAQLVGSRSFNFWRNAFI
jgi:hypothetical protein